MPMMNVQPVPPGGLLSQLQAPASTPPQGSGLINTAPNYSFPLTSGLLGSLTNPNTPPPSAASGGFPDYSALALQMAGNPKAGPLASVPVPSGTGIPGAGGGSSGGRSIGSTIGGLLTTMAQNPSLVKNAASAAGNIAKLFGDGGIPGIAAAAAPLAATPAAILGGADGFLGSGAIDASIQAGAGISPSVEAALSAAAPAADAAAPASGGLMSAVSGGAPDASAAAGAGSLGLGLLGAGATLAAPLYGASKPGVELGSQWYNNIGNIVGAGLNPGATAEQKLQAASQLDSLGLMQLNGTGGSSGLSTATNFDFGRLMDVLKPYGITSIQQAAALAKQLQDSIPAGQMPGQAANRFGTTTVGAGNLLDLIHPA